MASLLNSRPGQSSKIEHGIYWTLKWAGLLWIHLMVLGVLFEGKPVKEGHEPDKPWSFLSSGGDGH